MMDNNTSQIGDMQAEIAELQKLQSLLCEDHTAEISGLQATIRQLNLDNIIFANQIAGMQAMQRQLPPTYGGLPPPVGK
jgi:hypothetical protein